jgi:ABC-type multidrug transport system ATPase subunit
MNYTDLCFVTLRVAIALIGVYQGSLLQDLETGLLCYSILSLVMLLLYVPLDYLTMDISSRMCTKYSIECLEKYKLLPQADKDAHSIQIVTSKFFDAADAVSNRFAWGLCVLIELVTSLFGIGYMFVMVEQSWIMISFLVGYGLFYWFFLRHKADELQKIQTDTMEQRIFVGSVRRMWCERLETHRYAIDEISITLAESAKCDQIITIAWNNLSRMQNIPNCIMLIVIVLYVPAEKYVPIYLAFSKFEGAITQLSSFMNQLKVYECSISAATKTFENVELKEPPLQQRIPATLEISSNGWLDMNGLIINQGDKIIVKGPSGAGKTSLFRMLRGIAEGIDGINGQYHNAMTYTVQGSKAELNEMSIRDYFRRKTTKHCQEITDTSRNKQIISGSTYGAASTSTGCSFADNKIKEFLEIVCLTDWSKDKTLDEPVKSRYSGGEQSRLYLAEMLCNAEMNGSQMLLLDEPDQGVDRATANSMLKNIFAKFSKCTIMVIGHNIDFDSCGLFNQVWEVREGAVKVKVIK